MHSILLFGISGGEILIILLVVLILFGPSKIPEMARLIGRGVNEVKKVQREINTEIQRYSAEVEKEARKIKTDIDELKTEVKKSVEVDENLKKEYSYDQYGLDDEYSKSVGLPRSSDPMTPDAVTLDEGDSASVATNTTPVVPYHPPESEAQDSGNLSEAQDSGTLSEAQDAGAHSKVEDDKPRETVQVSKKAVVKKKRENPG